ncbi:MAG: RpiB/LacA/LacB family sugar-phosphate isomerase [Oscillospiraceae bacterium]
MKLVVASDFSAYTLKETVRIYLAERGYEVCDVGQQDNGIQIVYPVAAAALVKELQSGKYERGIIFCGTGAGVSITANKYKGIYCVPCESIFTASKSPIINNANVLAIGSNVVGSENACRIADLWLSQTFCKDFSPEREAFIKDLFSQLQDIENKNFK